jgi:hypothetical protein
MRSDPNVDEILEMNKSRPLTPADELVRDLEMTRRLLDKLCKRLEESGVERTFHLRRILGADCKNYRKSMALFVDEDFEQLREMVADLNDQFILIEGKIP